MENHTQQETPLLDKVCGEVTVTDPAHPLYGQTLPRLPMRINRNPLQVMVLLSSGRRHMVPRAATNLEREGVAISLASPLPSISVRTILPLARLVQQFKQAKEESHAEQTATPSTIGMVPWKADTGKSAKKYTTLAHELKMQKRNAKRKPVRGQVVVTALILIYQRRRTSIKTAGSRDKELQ